MVNYYVTANIMGSAGQFVKLYVTEAIFTLVAECLSDIRSVLLSVMICYSTTVRLRYCRLIV